jgi:hypothetical protein
MRSIPCYTLLLEAHMCVCVCVCVFKRERDMERKGNVKRHT